MKAKFFVLGAFAAAMALGGSVVAAEDGQALYKAKTCWSCHGQSDPCVDTENASFLVDCLWHRKMESILRRIL